LSSDEACGIYERNNAAMKKFAGIVFFLSISIA